MQDKILSFAEHALVIAGVAGVTDLVANLSGVTTDQTVVVIFGAVAGVIIRFLNKLNKEPAKT